MLTELETGLSFLPDNEKFDKTIILKIDIDDIIPHQQASSMRDIFCVLRKVHMFHLHSYRPLEDLINHPCGCSPQVHRYHQLTEHSCH